MSKGNQNEFSIMANSSGSNLSNFNDDGSISETLHADDSLPNFGDISEDFDFSDFLYEENIFGTSEVDLSSFDSALRDIQKPGKGLGKRSALESYSEEDFEDGAPRRAFILIRYYKNAIFKKDTNIKNILEAANFVFGRTIVGEMNFDLCCETLDVRRDVLRMRFHYEFFLRWMVFPAEFSFMIDPLPKIVENEILMYINEDARALAYEAWVQPGIKVEEMFNRANEGLDKPYSDINMNRWLHAMEERHLMSESAGHWYLTGRNPLIKRIETMHSSAADERGGTINWSKQW